MHRADLLTAEKLAKVLDVTPAFLCLR
ncbi:hypothetical protein [Polaromonas sp.]